MKTLKEVEAVKSTATSPARIWLRKHADYQRVYREGKRQSLPLMTFFFAPRVENRGAHPQQNVGNSRVGLTAGKVLGNAVERNRIKRRMRAAVRLHYAELAAGIDLVLHPRRNVLDAEFSDIERDVLRAFHAVQSASRANTGRNQPSHAR